MRPEPNPRLETYRYCPWGYYSPAGVNWGMFQVPSNVSPKKTLCVMSSGTDDIHGWEHVSVSTSNRCPTWAELQQIKELFWADDETVVQFHPAKADYVNRHPYCLHLWRRVRRPFELPPRHLIG